MNQISKIDEIRPDYLDKLLGDQVRIRDTPMGIRAGILTSGGKVENATPAQITHGVKAFALVANTDSQVVLCWPNHRHTAAFLVIKAAASTTSYDWRLYVHRTGYAVRYLYDGKGGTVAMQDGIASSNPSYYFIPSLPYGDDLSFTIVADNNHAVTDIALDVEVLMQRPVR